MENKAKILPAGFISKQSAVRGKRCLEHFGISSGTSSLYGHKEDEIINVEMVVSKNQKRPPANDGDMSVDYWGWYDFGRKRFNMIYGKYFLLDMCFPSGIDSSERVGQGKAYRLEEKIK